MFADRQEAGQLLARKLQKRGYGDKKTIVLGIPRGGVVVAKIVADYLKTPFDIMVVRKIGAPSNPELAIGATGPFDTVYWDMKLCKRLGIDRKTRNQELRIKNKEKDEREKSLRKNKPYPNLRDKKVILIDDGVATGATSIAAAEFIKKRKAEKIILAIPVIAKDTFLKIKRHFDEVIFLEQSEEFFAVGQFYEEFPQVEDKEVIAILNIK